MLEYFISTYLESYDERLLGEISQKEFVDKWDKLEEKIVKTTHKKLEKLTDSEPKS